MKTVRRPPYPKWNPGYFPCSSLTPLPLSSRRPSVSFGGFGLRRWQRGALPSERRRNRRGWRTRPDPFVDVWERDVEPLLRSDPEGELSATTILEWLDERHPGRFGSSHLRTLQRRIRDYRALHGPDREVYFQQCSSWERVWCISATVSWTPCPLTAGVLRTARL